VNIVELSTQRRVTIAMVTITLVMFGLIALSDLKVNLLPDLSYPTITVRTTYTGAAPSEIENLITEPVEEALGVVKNVRKVRSISQAGQSDVVLEFAWGTDMDFAGLEVRDKLEILQLPLEAKKPVLLRFNPSTEPILRLGLTGSSEVVTEAELKQLRRYVDDDLKKRLEPIAGVAAVKAGGGLEDEIQVDIDQQKSAQLNISIAEIAERLRAENVNVSGGRIEEGRQRYLVRTINQFASVDQIRDMLIKVQNGASIRIADVATVTQGYKEREAIIRINGREAVELALYKEGDANTVLVAEAVKATLARIEKNLLHGAKLTIVDDQSVFIREALSQVRRAAIEGGLLAILIIFFFLKDGWSTLVISLSLPVSIITTFFFMGQAGLSLNVMSLGGLALATGMVVDDSIVVLENIAKKREHGMGVFEAAVAGAKEVGMAVTASTLTTVAVFFPLVFVEGVAGQLFRDQALTVSIAMIISLLVAMTLIPMLASIKGKRGDEFPIEQIHSAKLSVSVRKGLADVTAWPLRTHKSRWVKVAGWVITLPIRLPLMIFLLPILLFAFILPPIIFYAVRWGAQLGSPSGRWLSRVLGRVGDFVLLPYTGAARLYHDFLPRAIENPAKILGVAALMFLGSVLLLPTLGLDLIPQLQQGRFEMTVRLPPGTALNVTDEMVQRIQQQHSQDTRINSIYGVSGTGTRLDANPTEAGENVGRLTIAMKPGLGDAEELAISDALRQTMKSYSEANVKFSRPQLFSFSAPLEIEISGYDLNAIDRAATDLAARLTAQDRYADVKSTVQEGYPEIQIQFDQDRAAALGLTTRQISDQIVKKVRGEVATRYSFRDRKIDVLVRTEASDRASVEDIRNLIVNPQSDKPVTLSSVAQVVSTLGPSQIHRADQQRVAVISAGLRYGDLGTAVEQIQQSLKDKPLGAGLGIRIGGQSEELERSVNSLIFALTLAIFLVYLVMASQFESLLHPFVIMFTIPLAMVGAVLALKITATPLSIVVFIGLILLVGVVVKNAIILIDRVNQLRADGVPKRLAILQAAESRLRPIVMTTVATLLGFLPLAIGTGEGSEVRAPMAIAVIGGLSVSTLLTLIVIPIVYDLLDRKSDSTYRERADKKRKLALSET
jgi:HAE1 family hydrophobic/amphiphilic exporter-1